MEAGIFPEKELESKESTVNAFKAPTVDGIEPLNMFSYKSITFSPVSSPILDGTLPDSEL